MKKEKLMWLGKYLDQNLVKEASNKSDEVVELLISYINLNLNNLDINIIKKIIRSDSLEKSKLIAKLSLDNDFMMSSDRTYDEKMFLLEKIKNAKSDLNAKYIANIISNKSINKKRTFSEQIKFIDETDSLCDEANIRVIYNLMKDSNLIDKRTFSEQFELIDFIKYADTDLKKEYMQKICLSMSVLKKYSSKQPLELLSKVFKTPTDIKILHTSNYINLILDKRTFEEQLAVLDKILSSKTDQISGYVGYVASNPLLLNNLDSKNHNKILDKINNAEDDEKALCMTLYVLNKHKIDKDDIQNQLEIMNHINSLNSNIKVDYLKKLVCKGNIFNSGDYQKQSTIIKMISVSDDYEILNHLTNWIEKYNNSYSKPKQKIKGGI